MKPLFRRPSATATGNSAKGLLITAGKPVCRSNIWKEMKELCIEAKVEPGKVFPHNLRHLFARIFYRNSINIGLPIIESKEAAEKIKNGDTVSVDFDSGIITDETTGETFKGQAFPPFMQKLIDAGGLINYVNKEEA